jgi:CARDB protein
MGMTGLPFRLRKPRTATAALLVLTGMLPGSVLAGGSARPDLVETTLSVSFRTGQGAPSLRVADSVRNQGRVAAPRSTTGYYLSRDRTRGRGDRRLGRRAVGRLLPGGVSRGSARLSIPGSIAQGAYQLLACADDRGRVSESGERNNCLATRHPLNLTDPTPPVFAGLEAATTCLPGPAGTGRKSSYHLRWHAATDNLTPSSRIVYDVYQTTMPRGEDFSAPTYTTGAGATTFSTPPLPEENAYSFVVRARDRAGNRDRNRVERLGENLCL